MKRRTLRVLQLASFDGNIGDNANHMGTRALFERYSQYEFDVTRLEMREFYWGERHFDASFVELANQYDLLMVGGGNYFELWVEGSATGTSFDITPALFSAIRVPVLFWSLGVDPGQGVSDTSLEHFRTFMDTLLESTQYFVSIRNDGSAQAIREYLGDEYLDRISVMPDGGFFFQPDGQHHDSSLTRPGTLAINLACDMPSIRFSTMARDNDGYESFVEGMARTLSDLLSAMPEKHLLFVPHIYSDLKVVSDVVTAMPDPWRRRHVEVAACLHGDDGANYNFSLYAQCELVFAMRFHANACNIGMGIPTIGLANYRQIRQLYREINLDERLVDVNTDAFSGCLLECALKSISHTGDVKKKYIEIMSDLETCAASGIASIDAWLNSIES